MLPITLSQLASSPKNTPHAMPRTRPIITCAGKLIRGLLPRDLPLPLLTSGVLAEPLFIEAIFFFADMGYRYGSYRPTEEIPQTTCRIETGGLVQLVEIRGTGQSTTGQSEQGSGDQQQLYPDVQCQHGKPLYYPDHAKIRY
jgi:hypothetical protein